MTFDDLRYEEFHSKAFNFDLEKLPPTSESNRNTLIIINAICGLTQQAMKVYFYFLYIMVTF